jgi:hypothetical protein
VLGVFMLIPVAQAQGAKINITLAGIGSGEVTVTHSTAGELGTCSNIPPESDESCAFGHVATNFATITLTATPGPDTQFEEWNPVSGGGEFGNCLAGTANSPCSFTNGGELQTKNFTANFSGEAENPAIVNIDEVGPADVNDSEAILRGTVNPSGSAINTCRFEVIAASDPQNFSSAAVKEAPCDPDPAGIGDGEDPEDVSAAVTGLQLNTIYRARLFTFKQAGDPQVVVAETLEPFRTHGLPPVVVTGRAWSLSDTAATLVATVNPNNADVTACSFEYGLTTDYGQVEPCEPDPGAGSTPASVLHHISGLQPNTTYHFRIVAENDCAIGCGSEVGENETFQTYASFTFAKRGFELVSAEQMNGIDAYPVTATSNGDHYAYFTFIPAPGAANGTLNGAFRSSRLPDGSWSQLPVGASPVAGEGISEDLPLFSASDFSVATRGGRQSRSADDQNEVPDTYLQDLVDRSFTWLSRDPSIPPGTPQVDSGGASAVYVSPDGQRALFSSTRRLLPSDVSTTSAQSLYEWHSGLLRLVGLKPGSDEGFAGGSELGSGTGAPSGSIHNAVSRDGDRVVFQAPDTVGRTHLYVRLDGERTVEASASSGVTPEVTSPRQVRFAGASSSGGVIFFTSASRLTPDSTAEGSDSSICGAGGNSCDLYAYHPGSESLHNVTGAAVLTGEVGGGGVRRVYAVSDDGRRVYFTSTRKLEGVGGEGGFNLYLAELDDGGALEGPLRFIATVDAQEDASGQNTGGVNRPQSYREVATNPAGSLLAFRTRLAAVPGRQTGGLPQVFVYDAVRGELNCASCPSDGSPPATEANLAPSAYFYNSGTKTYRLGVATIGSTNVHTPPVRNVGSDGSVFFQTPSSLLAADINEGKIDVYQWHSGQLGLISSGAGSFDTIYGSASTDGRTVFFASRDRLVEEAEAGALHIYAARVGGGSPLPTTPSPACEAADCRDPLAAAPIAKPTGTATFHGAGNLLRDGRERCSRGRVLRSGRCASIRALARRVCGKKRGAAKRRCISRQIRRIGRAKHQLRRAQIRRTRPNLEALR